MAEATQPGYERVLELKDGTRVHVRPIRPDDEERLHEVFSRMSERSVYLRFFSPLKRLPEELARRLARVDYDDRFALCAVTHRPDGGEHILGVARYDRVPGTDTAEVAVAVVDELQRRGLGSGLLGLLTRVAREHGIARFVLVVLPENQSMLGLLRSLGWIHHAEFRGGVHEISFDI
jgi:RimJ/RimL family protein N-acetyltransferase